MSTFPDFGFEKHSESNGQHFCVERSTSNAGPWPSLFSKTRHRTTTPLSKISWVLRYWNWRKLMEYQTYCLHTSFLILVPTLLQNQTKYADAVTEPTPTGHLIVNLWTNLQYASYIFLSCPPTQKSGHAKWNEPPKAHQHLQILSYRCLPVHLRIIKHHHHSFKTHTYHFSSCISIWHNHQNLRIHSNLGKK